MNKLKTSRMRGDMTEEKKQSRPKHHVTMNNCGLLENKSIPQLIHSQRSGVAILV